MKKVILTLAIIFLLTISVTYAQTWHSTNQVTIGWDAVTTLSNGDPIPPGDSVTYRVYIADADNDPDKTNKTLIDEVSDIQYTIQFVQEARYFIGISAVRNATVSVESTISWSDDPTICLNNEDFGVVFFHPLSNPTGLHKQ